MVAFQPFADEATALDLDLEKFKSSSIEWRTNTESTCASSSSRCVARSRSATPSGWRHRYNTVDEVDRAVDTMIKLTAGMS